MGTFVLVVLGALGIYLAIVYLAPRYCPGCHRQVVAGYSRCPFCQTTYPPRADPLRDLRDALQRLASGGTPHLVCIRGPWQGREFYFDKGQLNLGQAANNHVRLQDADVAEHHAVIAGQARRYVLYDYGTVTGTYVNDRAIRQHVLRPGDRIQIGRSLFVFQAGYLPSLGRPAALSEASPPRPALSWAKGLRGLTIGRKLSGSGALLALLCFFLPWIEFSCAGMQVRASGFEVATSSEMGGARWLLFLVPLAALAVLWLIYRALNRHDLTPWRTSGGTLLAGLAGLLSTAAVYVGLQNARNDPSNLGFGLFLNLLAGYWGAVAGFVAVLAGGFLDRKEGQ